MEAVLIQAAGAGVMIVGAAALGRLGARHEAVEVSMVAGGTAGGLGGVCERAAG